jgi:hypothetical protein
MQYLVNHPWHLACCLQLRSRSPLNSDTGSLSVRKLLLSFSFR